MKATGIVRRVDDLGRVVIPKEIRRTMRIREGDQMEIFTEKNCEIIFQKYSPLGELGSFAAEYAQSLFKASRLPAAVCDRDTFIACAGIPRRELEDKPISERVGALIDAGSTYTCAADTPLGRIAPVEDSKREILCLCPISSDGGLIGAVMFLCAEGADCAGEAEVKLLTAAADLLSRKIEF